MEIVRRRANGAWGLGLSEEQCAPLARCADLLVEWNATRMNLTPSPGVRVLDVGTARVVASLERLLPSPAVWG